MKPRIYTISVCGVFGLLLLLAAAPPKLSTYVGKFYGDGANLTNVAGGGGSQVWTNDGRRTYVLQSSDSILVGTNSPGVLGTSSARGFSFAFLTANGEPTEVVTKEMILDSGDFNFGAIATKDINADKDSSYLQATWDAFLTNGSDHSFTIVADPGNAAGGSRVALIVGSTEVFKATANGIVTANGYVVPNLFISPTNAPSVGQAVTATSTAGASSWQSLYSSNIINPILSWSGPSNAVTVYPGFSDWFYASATPVSLTNVLGATVGQKCTADLTISNSSAGTFTNFCTIPNAVYVGRNGDNQGTNALTIASGKQGFWHVEVRGVNRTNVYSTVEQ